MPIFKSGKPGGANTQVQFNDNGAFGANAEFVFVKSALPTPNAPVITQGGTPGTTAYSYKVAWQSKVGPGNLSPAGSTATGAATLSGTNYNIIDPGTAPDGAVTYLVWRFSSSGSPNTLGLIGKGTPGVPFHDDGSVTSAYLQTPYWLTADQSQGAYAGGRVTIPTLGDVEGPVLTVGSRREDFSPEIQFTFGEVANSMAYHGTVNTTFEVLNIVQEATNWSVYYPMSLFGFGKGSGSGVVFNLVAGASGSATVTQNVKMIETSIHSKNPNATLATFTHAHIGNGGFDNVAGTVTTEVGIHLDLAHGTNRYGLYSTRNASANHFLIYSTGTLASYFGGGVGIGVVPGASAALQVDSTTKAFLPPRMTTTQRDAITSPVEGMVIYNTTDHALNFHNGTTWGAV